MVDKKYYTPELEEFHIGFEYEWSPDGGKTWIEEKADMDNILLAYSSFEHSEEFKEEYRVSYLNKEDFINLGFDEVFYKIFIARGEEEDYKFYKLNQIGLPTESPSKHIPPYKISNTEESVAIFLKIKNKSELKRLMKQLGIPCISPT